MNDNVVEDLDRVDVIKIIDIPETQDATETFNTAISEIKTAGYGTILLPRPYYKFTTTTTYAEAVSNHETISNRQAYVIFNDCDNLMISATSETGSVFEFENPDNIGLVFDKCDDVTLENITIKHTMKYPILEKVQPFCLTDQQMLILIT